LSSTTKFFDLFAGIGGFHLGLKKNFQCVGACEIDRYARQVYSRHFPKVKIWEDATKIKPEELPDFDMLCAGFPCQAFSVAGKRLGFEESRGTLFYEIVRIAREKRPRIIFLENVKGLLYHDEGRTFTTIIKTFYELGYDIEWQVINSKHFVPQNRERIFIIGHLRNKSKSEVFPIIEKCKVNVGTRRKTSKDGTWFRSEISGTVDANYAKGGGSRTMIHVIGSKQEHAAHMVNQSPALTEAMGKGGGHVPMIYMSQTNCHFVNRIQDRDKTWTLTNNSKAFGLLQNGKIRSFTPLECERLQGFPDGYTEGLSDTQRYKCLGNAVTVPVIEYIGEFLN